jgi:hypothetical protein
VTGESTPAPDGLQPSPGIAPLLVPIRVRAIELHEAQAHGHGEREVRDLGDAILLHDPFDDDPFVNRLSALRLPDDPDACDRRLAELFALFAGLRRRPHAWLSPAFATPADLEDRLRADGFIDYGGMYVLVQMGHALPPPAPRGTDVRLERLSAAGDPRRVARAAAEVMIDAFATEGAAVDQVAADLERADRDRWDVTVAWAEDEPVSAGRRYTADGMTYLSSIGTRRRWWGRGFAAVVTSELAADGVAAGGPLVHLGVEAENTRAKRLYARLGFEVLGGRVADLLLA